MKITSVIPSLPISAGCNTLSENRTVTSQEYQADPLNKDTAGPLKFMNVSNENEIYNLQDSNMKSMNVSSSSPLERHMVIQSQIGIVKPNPEYTLISMYFPIREPKCLSSINNPLWLEAMHEELRALEQHDTWTSVPWPPDMGVLGRN